MTITMPDFLERMGFQDFEVQEMPEKVKVTFFLSILEKRLSFILQEGERCGMYPCSIPKSVFEEGKISQGEQEYFRRSFEEGLKSFLKFSII